MNGSTSEQKLNDESLWKFQRRHKKPEFKLKKSLVKQNEDAKSKLSECLLLRE